MISIFVINTELDNFIDLFPKSFDIYILVSFYHTTLLIIHFPLMFYIRFCHISIKAANNMHV